MENNPKRYMTTREAAMRWNIFPDRVSELCRHGKIPGAAQENRRWKIPADAPHPLSPKGPKK